MDENKSLLQQVREKEQVLNVKLELIARDAEKLMQETKKEAANIINKADKEAKEAASSYYAGEQKKIDAEVDAIKQKTGLDAAMIRERERANMPAAVERIIKEVTMQ